MDEKTARTLVRMYGAVLMSVPAIIGLSVPFLLFSSGWSAFYGVGLFIIGLPLVSLAFASIMLWRFKNRVPAMVVLVFWTLVGIGVWLFFTPGVGEGIIVSLSSAVAILSVIGIALLLIPSIKELFASNAEVKS